MGIKVNLDKEKEQHFREKSMKKFGYKKGALTHALNEAIDLWLAMEEDELPLVNQPTKMLRGLLKEVKDSSIELQHQSKALFIK